MDPLPLLPNLVAFLRGLRRLGFQVDADDEAAVFTAVQRIGVVRHSDVKYAIQAVVVRSRTQQGLFDTAWRQFLLLLTRPANHVLSDQTLLANVARLRQQTHLRPQILWLGGMEGSHPDDDAQEPEAPAVPLTVGTSREEVLRQTDFALLSADEQAEIGKLHAAVQPLLHISRRRRSTAQGAEIDLAQVVRNSVRDRDALTLPRLSRRHRERPVVLLCDVSGSMDPYSRLLLRFAYALMKRGISVETYVFSTRLTRITQALRLRDPDQALSEVAARTPDFSGGTRLDDALQAFFQSEAKQRLRQGAILLIASDGLDTGDPERLQTNLVRLRRLAHRLIWLNPAAAQPGFAPLARGASRLREAADDIIAVNSWGGLEAFWRTLQNTHRHRPVR
jgi:uncharacterized protein with von Willebrand factor type A (vWA) domain